MARTIKAPYQFATNGNYAAGALDWSGLPRVVEPSGAALADGWTPDAPVPAETLNFLEQLKADALAVQAHGALRKWSRAVTTIGSGATWTCVVGIKPSRAYDAGGERQRMPILLAPSGGSRLVVAISNDGSAFDTPRTLNAGDPFSVSAAASCAVGECLAIDGTTATVQYTTNHGNSFTVVASAFAGAAVHYVPSTGKYLFLDSHGGLFVGTSLASFGTWTSTALAATAADPLISEFADDGGLNVVLVSRVSGHAFASIFRSADGGVTWAFVANTGSFFANVTYSPARGLFYLWGDDGTIQSSQTGAAWASIASSLTTTKGFFTGAKTLACVGPAIVKAWNYQPSANFTQRGIIYSLDGAVTWNTYAFGEAPVAGAPIAQLRTINNRLFLVDSVGLWASEPLEAPAAEI